MSPNPQTDQATWRATFFGSATFATSASHPSEFPPCGGPEVAFAGRSNSGKSSAINSICAQSGLARVSKTPGRTRLINFFRLGSGYLVDLPGYGYAAVPRSTRKLWLPLIEHYLSNRDSLTGLVLVMDARHPLTDLDRHLIDWFFGTGRPILALLTKSDKLSRGDARLTLDRVRREISRCPVASAAELFSAPKKVGLDPAREIIMAWLEKNKPPVKGEKTGG